MTRRFLIHIRLHLNLKAIFCFDHMKFYGILFCSNGIFCRFYFSFIIKSYRFTTYYIFGGLSRRNGIIHTLIYTQIVCFLLKNNFCYISISNKVHTTSAGSIIYRYFIITEDIHGSTIHSVQIKIQNLIVFLFLATTAFHLRINEGVIRYINLIPAITDTNARSQILFYISLLTDIG